MYSFLKPHSLVLTGILISSSAIAEEHKAYVQFNAGAAFAQPFTEGFEQCFSPFGCNSFSRKEKFDTGFMASLALGYHLTEKFRLEGEAMYQSNDLKNFTTKQNSFGTTFTNSGSLQGERERTTFLLNAYYDFKNSSAFTPYITGGVGGYHMRIKTGEFGRRASGENDLDFAWQVGAGLNYKLDDRISFDLRYRYFGGSAAEVVIPRGLGFVTSNGITFVDRTELHNVGDHQVMAGIRIAF